jgi:hypothetical protein
MIGQPSRTTRIIEKLGGRMRLPPPTCNVGHPETTKVTQTSVRQPKRYRRHEREIGKSLPPSKSLQ